MANKLRVVVLGLCIAGVAAFRVEAQPTPPGGHSQANGEVKQLREEMQALRRQAEPLRRQMQQLMAQIKALREQMRPIMEKIRADRQKLGQLLRSERGERGERGEHNWQAGLGQGNQEQWKQRPSASGAQ